MDLSLLTLVFSVVLLIDAHGARVVGMNEDPQTQSDRIALEATLNRQIPAASHTFVSLAGVFASQNLVDFNSSSLYIPSYRTVQVTNTLSAPLRILSYGTLDSGVFKVFKLSDTVLVPGGQVTVYVGFIPKSLGVQLSAIVLVLDSGNFYIDLKGEGVPNEYRMKEIEFFTLVEEQSVYVYNPFDEVLHI